MRGAAAELNPVISEEPLVLGRPPRVQIDSHGGGGIVIYPASTRGAAKMQWCPHVRRENGLFSPSPALTHQHP